VYLVLDSLVASGWGQILRHRERWVSSLRRRRRSVGRRSRCKLAAVCGFEWSFNVKRSNQSYGMELPRRCQGANEDIHCLDV
jgi:hypothetical protein